MIEKIQEFSEKVFSKQKPILTTNNVEPAVTEKSFPHMRADIEVPNRLGFAYSNLNPYLSPPIRSQS